MGKIEQELEDWVKSALPIYQFLDLRINSVSNGVYQCFVPLSKNTGNHVNTVHAAVQFASAEIMGGLVVLSTRADEKYVPVVKSVEIQFKRPALSGITAEAAFSDRDVEAMNASLESTGGYDFELGSVIRNADGDTVAEARGSYAVRTME